MTVSFRWIAPAVTLVLLALIAWAYWPALSGPFLFDDFGNLDVLGGYGRIDGWKPLLFYVTSGNGDPVGRPLSLLTFLFDASSWPAAPAAFKRTNLVIHLLDTALLAIAIARLQARLPHATSRWAPALAAALWGAHPFLLSTVMYVVQREAMLPLAFVLLALLAWERAVAALERGASRAAWTWALAGFGGATLLAGLCKANGFLAPVLVGLAYLCILRPRDGALARRSDRMAWITLGLPSLAVLVFLLSVAWHLWPMGPIPGRGWSIAHRLLSEPRALWTYVGHLLLPRAGGGGLFVEDFPVSTGWLSPWTTLPAWGLLLASGVFAFVVRHRHPRAAFAWLFFLAGHLFESTVVPLELYFEHRTYLPSAFLAWPLAGALLAPEPYARYRQATLALLLAAFLLLTHERAKTWGDATLLATLTATHETDSPRSQVDAAKADVQQGKIGQGLVRMHRMQLLHPDSVDVAISTIGLECATQDAVAPSTFDRALATLATARTWNYGLYEWLRDATQDERLLHCRGLGLPGLATLVDAIARNPVSESPPRKRDLWHARGRIALAQHRPEAALHWFDAGITLLPDADYALVQAAALGDAGTPGLGVRHIDRFLAIQRDARTAPIRDMVGVHRWLLRRYYYPTQLAELRARLLRDATAASATSGGR